MKTCHILAHSFAATWLALAVAGPASAAVTKAERAAAAATLRTDLAACNNGSTKQTRAACVAEAHAAHSESLRGALGDAMPGDSSNASKRCEVLSGRDQDACMARMSGMGKQSGTAADGGIYRELTVTMPAKPAASAAQ